MYSETWLKWPLKKIKNGFQDQLLLNAGQKYCRMLQREHSTILSTFIKLPFVIKIFVLSIFEGPLNTDFTVVQSPKIVFILANSADPGDMLPLQHFIKVFTVCKGTHLGVPVYKGLTLSPAGKNIGKYCRLMSSTAYFCLHNRKIFKQWRLWRVCAFLQAYLSLCCLTMWWIPKSYVLALWTYWLNQIA